MHSISQMLRSPQVLAAMAAGLSVGIGVTAYLTLRRRPTPEEREERRRTRLAQVGRIIDGTLVDSAPEVLAGEVPRVLIYRYSVAGVSYECGQDVSALAALLPDLGPTSTLFGTPVQVRYDRDNPADSMVVCETWNGLWTQTQDASGHV